MKMYYRQSEKQTDGASTVFLVYLLKKDIYCIYYFCFIKRHLVDLNWRFIDLIVIHNSLQI